VASTARGESDAWVITKRGAKVGACSWAVVTSSKPTKARKRACPIPLHSLHIVSDFEPAIRSLLECPLLKGVFGFSRAKVSVRCHTSALFNPAFHHSERIILRSRCIKLLHSYARSASFIARAAARLALHRFGARGDVAGGLGHEPSRRGPICSSVRLLGLFEFDSHCYGSGACCRDPAIHAVSAIKLVFGTARKDEDPWRWAGRDAHPLEYIEAPH
jgi:hypothetical protein